MTRLALAINVTIEDTKNGSDYWERELLSLLKARLASKDKAIVVTSVFVPDGKP